MRSTQEWLYRPRDIDLHKAEISALRSLVNLVGLFVSCLVCFLVGWLVGCFVFCWFMLL
jgi:hypothetical protein